jgi:hypothetical protein
MVFVRLSNRNGCLQVMDWHAFLQTSLEAADKKAKQDRLAKVRGGGPDHRQWSYHFSRTRCRASEAMPLVLQDPDVLDI